LQIYPNFVGFADETERRGQKINNNFVGFADETE